MGDVRVRFAPSPTGYLHVGGARTAIFNWLFARQHDGAYVLRIEDTDQARSTRASEASLIADLEWLGLNWQEGPLLGGPHAPYRQSERMALYKERAGELVEAGHAYPCFCSEEDLAAKKEAAQKAGEPPQYDGTCKDLSLQEIEEKHTAGVPFVIRFNVPEGSVKFHDVVRGDMEFGNDTVGDFVILRSNKLPTYNFAAAVDDGVMEITHVLRGEEHLPNTLRQMLIYNTLDMPVPQFAHLPLILAEDRSKLSKRHGASSVEDLRAAGFLPDAVVNYLVLLGWSHPKGEEVLTRDELVESFSLERVNKAAAVYDRKKLRWMNGQWIRKTPLDELLPLAEPFFPDWLKAEYDPERRKQILAILHDGFETLADLPEACAPFRNPPEYTDEAKELLATDEAKAVLTALSKRLEASDAALTSDSFKEMIKAAGAEAGAKGKGLYWPIRAALTGSVHGPDLAGVAALKGREAVQSAIHAQQG